MKCHECKRKIALAEELLCECRGCHQKYCVSHRGNHLMVCKEFDHVKKEQEKNLLTKKILEEATKAKQIEII